VSVARVEREATEAGPGLRRRRWRGSVRFKTRSRPASARSRAGPQPESRSRSPSSRDGTKALARGLARILEPNVTDASLSQTRATQPVVPKPRAQVRFLPGVRRHLPAPTRRRLTPNRHTRTSSRANTSRSTIRLGCAPSSCTRQLARFPGTSPQSESADRGRAKVLVFVGR
jgi:hypothetical protein